VIKADVKDKKRLILAMKGCSIVYHFASNPDIAKAQTQPDIDFWEGTYLTNNVLEAMRVNKVKNIIYASGSGVYGDGGFKSLKETHAPMLPISTYGASKLAGEALICAYCHMFGLNGVSFRFANVVGPRQTHGVGYDFVRQLIKYPDRLRILGNGKQSKSYIYVTDVINAMRLIEKKEPKGFSYFNVSTWDYISVNGIAEITFEIAGAGKLRCSYTGGSRGWKGDIPVVRLDSKKIRRLGWKNRYTTKEAIRISVQYLYEEAKQGHSKNKVTEPPINNGYIG